MSLFAHWSITRRLSVAFALTSLIVMSVAGIYLAGALESQLAGEHLVFMSNDVEVIRGKLADISGAPTDRIEASVRQVIAPVGSRLHIAILENGRNLLEPAPWLEIPNDALPVPVPPGTSPQETAAWKAPDGKRFRVVTAAAQVGHEASRSVVIALALDVSIEQHLVSGYRTTLLVTLMLAVLGSAITGYLVSRQGLRPIRHIAAAANEITSSQLDRKLDIEDAPEEIRDLVAAFNRMLDRLRDSFDRLTQFSSDIAHELRTPINNLMGEAQVALSRARSAAEYRTVLESGVEEFERLSKMIENMLFLARADSAESVIEAGLLDARAELEKVAEFYQLVADESGVRILCGGAAKLWADPLLFRRVINNLLSNALRYPEGGQVIRLEAVESADGSVAISVANPGAGIPPAHLTRIFDRFYRADLARERSGEGTGLGLSIVRTIMQLHGGSVSASSDPGGMTVFTLKFPPPQKGAAT